jgi:hypothetical protein
MSTTPYTGYFLFYQSRGSVLSSDPAPFVSEFSIVQFVAGEVLKFFAVLFLVRINISSFGYHSCSSETLNIIRGGNQPGHHMLPALGHY